MAKQTFLVKPGKQDAEFEIDKSQYSQGSGIKLKSFTLDGIRYSVTRVVNYFPVRWGKSNPGAGQRGIYELNDGSGEPKFAVIDDYRAIEGDWRILLEGEITDRDNSLDAVVNASDEDDVSLKVISIKSLNDFFKAFGIDPNDWKP